MPVRALTVTGFLQDRLEEERARLERLAQDPAGVAQRTPIQNRVWILEDLLAWARLENVGFGWFVRTLQQIRDLQPGELSPILFRHDPLGMAPRVAADLLSTPALLFQEVMDEPDPHPRVPRSELLRILRIACKGVQPISAFATPQIAAQGLIGSINTMAAAGLIEVQGAPGKEEIRLTPIGKEIAEHNV